MPRVLVVDDDQPVRQLLARFLKQRDYDVAEAGSPDEALAAVSREHFDLVMSDVRMPGGSGIDLLADLRAHYPDLPVVMVSGLNDPEFAGTALDIGAYGYVTKPFDGSQVIIAAVNAIRRAKLERENRTYQHHLEAMVAERTDELSATLGELQDVHEQLLHASELTINALSQAIEGRDVETGQHVTRVSRYAHVLAKACGFDDEDAHLISVASAMHDIGKVGVPDGILFKPGTFTPAEYNVIKQHSELGYRILSKSSQPLLSMAASIAFSHHERWDGSGYPQELAGDAIPIEGRIAAVADVFDAIVSRRVYKPAYPVERALDILQAGRGTSFDGDVIDAFFAHLDTIIEIRNSYPDT